MTTSSLSASLAGLLLLCRRRGRRMRSRSCLTTPIRIGQRSRPTRTFRRPPASQLTPRGSCGCFIGALTRLMKFDPAGRLLASFGDGLYGRPHAGSRRSRRRSLDGGRPGATLSSRWTPMGAFAWSSAERIRLRNRLITSISPPMSPSPSDGSIFVSDGYGNSRVAKYSKSGTYVTAWGKKGTGEGEFNIPHSIVIDSRDRVYVGDRENHRIQIFDTSGRFLEQWKNTGSPWGSVSIPTAVTCGWWMAIRIAF